MAGRVVYIENNPDIPEAGKALHRALIARYGSIQAAAFSIGYTCASIYTNIRRGKIPEWIPDDVKKKAQETAG